MRQVKYHEVIYPKQITPEDVSKLKQAVSSQPIEIEPDGVTVVFETDLLDELHFATKIQEGETDSDLRGRILRLIDLLPELHACVAKPSRQEPGSILDEHGLGGAEITGQVVTLQYYGISCNTSWTQQFLIHPDGSWDTLSPTDTSA